MSRIPKDPKEIFDEFTRDYQRIYGDDLVSIILYGSAAGKDYVPGRSDINFMIVLTEEGIRDPERSFALVKKWRKRNVAVPLFLTEGYIETSTDVYPIEYLNFQRRYITVFGKEILKGLSLKKEFIRLQAEREIKGKLLLLREAYLGSSGKKAELTNIINQSLHALIAIFNALLFIKDIDIPEGSRSLMISVCNTFGLENNVFMRLVHIREGKIKPDEKELNGIFKEYLNEINKLSKIVDELGG
jgi:predicted nucleotidyltransferase